MATTRKVFKKWYTLNEAAAAINNINGDSLSTFDMIDMLICEQLQVHCVLQNARVFDSPFEHDIKNETNDGLISINTLLGVFEIDKAESSQLFFTLLNNLQISANEQLSFNINTPFKIWIDQKENEFAYTFGCAHITDTPTNGFDISRLLIFHKDLEALLSSGRDDISSKKLTGQTESTQSANKKLMMIGSLCHALINGLTGQHMKDSNLIVEELERRGLPTVSAKTLGKYLSDNEYMHQNDTKI